MSDRPVPDPAELADEIDERTGSGSAGGDGGTSDGDEQPDDADAPT